MTKNKNNHILEIILVLVSLCLCCILYEMQGYKWIVLNLFYLPIVLAAFYLGRYRAGVFSLFCVIVATTLIALDISQFSTYMSPLGIGLSVVVWGSVLGITTILVGTLSDERTAKIIELKEAHLGVIEVLSHYLQTEGPVEKRRTNQVADLSRKVAKEMKLAEKEVENIRVAALLQDMENIEVTAKVIRSAMGNLEGPVGLGMEAKYTFQGSDLVHSLGEVLTGAIPLLIDHEEPIDNGQGSVFSSSTRYGVAIIHAVRDYQLIAKMNSDTHEEILEEMQRHAGTEYNPEVLKAIDKVIRSEKSGHSITAIRKDAEEILETENLRNQSLRSLNHILGKK